jgi:hypothetical protein
VDRADRERVRGRQREAAGRSGVETTTTTSEFMKAVCSESVAGVE